MKIYILKESFLSGMVSIVDIFQYKSKALSLKEKLELPYKNWHIKPSFYIETLKLNTEK